MPFSYRVAPLVLSLLLLFPATAHAQEGSPAPSEEKAKLINELFEVSPYKMQIDTMLDSVCSILAGNIQKNIQSNLTKDGKMTEDEAKQQAIILSDKIIKNFKKRLDIQPEILTVFSTTYSKNFTEQELKDMIAFNKSPAGVKTKEKMPVLLAETTARMQKKLDPIIESKMREKIQELAKKQQGAEAAK
ncbi:MAG: DUF2059 domain-containing protein [Cyanobacteria bacterium]|nr:DUF2059 domain-containing protein [Cyanobacteriota bacterium]